MKLNEKELIAERSYKKVYKSGDRIVKVFSETHPKANVFNEALIQARVEETGLNIPKVLEVSDVGGQWAIAMECAEGKTMEQLMKEEGAAKYMGQFVDLQLEMHSKTAPQLNRLKDKLSSKINSLKELDATTRYELRTRLDSMPKHTKLCHCDFNPSNVIVGSDGQMSIIDWSHAAQGNASADAAITYLQFALKDQALADTYLDTFCKKSDTAKQYVQQWMPIAAAYQLTKGVEEEKDFLLKWADIFDYQ